MPSGRLQRPLEQSSDKRLARRATRGDERALGAIFERYQQELYRFCLGLLGEPQDAQDALQNTMVKALRALPGEKREIALRPWLYRIAHNEAINLRRGTREVEALDWQLLDGQSNVTERVEQRERLEWLFRDLGDLPPRQRAVLVMRELSGLDFADIGAALGTSGAVVRQSLYEARRNLEQMDRGRGLRCEAVMRVLSDADGRISSRREIRAHVRDCPDCQRFQDRIEARKATFASIAPLPIGAAVGFPSALAGGSGASGITAALGGGAASSVGTAGVLKAVATVAAVAVVGTATVGRNPKNDQRSTGDVVVAPLAKGGHVAPANSPRKRSPSPPGAPPPAPRVSVARAPATKSASPTTVVPGKPSAPVAGHRVMHVSSSPQENEFSVPASSAPGESLPTTKATPGDPSRPENASPPRSEKADEKQQSKIVKKAEKQEEKAARVEPTAAPEEAPKGAESAPPTEGEGSPESALHSPKGKAKGHEKQLAN